MYFLALNLLPSFLLFVVTVLLKEMSNVITVLYAAKTNIGLAKTMPTVTCVHTLALLTYYDVVDRLLVKCVHHMQSVQMGHINVSTTQ